MLTYCIYMSYKLIAKILLGGGNLEDENKLLRDEIAKLKQKNEALIQDLNAKEAKPLNLKDIDQYNELVNLKAFLRSQDDPYINPDAVDYDEDDKEPYKNNYFYKNDGLTAFDRNLKRNPNYYRQYQKDFIENWSLSTQECCILYYGAGSGKSNIAVNCAEQFIELNNNSHVYFLSPASLVLNTMNEMFKFGIDPNRKYNDTDHVYHFVSYQQLLRSKFNFKPNSLLIVDEAHNLRNFQTVDNKERISAMKWKSTGAYSFIGSKLAEKLMLSDTKFNRTIFMTGTLFVNTPTDIEAILSIGFKKAPLVQYFEKQYYSMINDPQQFKMYYEGLISYYQIADDNKAFPKKNFIFEPVYGKAPENPNPSSKGQDSYWIHGRNSYNIPKNKWVVDFLKKHKKEKTIIYTQFIDRSITLLEAQIKKDIPDLKFGVIDGRLKASDKMALVKKYNDNEINVLIFTLAIKEGISFTETKNIIMIQPYWNWAIMEQIIARGIRLTSHKDGDKSTVNIYMLVGIEGKALGYNKKGILEKDLNIDKTPIKKWIDMMNKIFNTGIKKLVRDKDDKDRMTVYQNMEYKPWGRDADIYAKELDKQLLINEFEQKLLALPKFEQVNNTDNNEFNDIYNIQLFKLEEKNKDKQLSNKDKILLKRQIYNELYGKSIGKIANDFQQFNTGVYKAKGQEAINEVKDYPDKTKEIEKVIKTNSNIPLVERLFKQFGIDKTVIFKYQANFTPQNSVDQLIEQCGIKNDRRPELKILEPTAGIGNVINGLMQLPNKENFQIDCNELNNMFFQMGKTMFKDVKNVFWYNMDFMDYNRMYNYDYILGNPPFNLRDVMVKKYNKRTKKIDLIKTNLNDIDFVAHAFNKLNEDGSLTMIISNSYTFHKEPKFNKFNKYLDLLRSEDAVIENDMVFKEVGKKTVAKAQETGVKMKIITLVRKKAEWVIDLNEDELLNQQEYDDKIKADAIKKTEAKVKKEGIAVEYQTYINFANKYNLPTKTKEGKNITASTLSTSIKDYETKNNIQNGLYEIEPNRQKVYEDNLKKEYKEYVDGLRRGIIPQTYEEFKKRKSIEL